MPRTAAHLLASLVLLAVVSPVCAEEEISLFNGTDLTGWTYELSKDVPMEQVWSVTDGVLACTGKPSGYLRTEKDYANYKLTLQWRWTGKPGNNGVLVHTSTPGALGIWPKSLEVQLASGNAGDFWVIGTEIDVPNEKGRVRGRRHLNLTDDSEKPRGEWNTMVVYCFEDQVAVMVNDDLVNMGTNSTVTSGAISLQSEGAPIEYRDIKLTPITAMPALPAAAPAEPKGSASKGSGKKGSGKR